MTKNEPRLGKRHAGPPPGYVNGSEAAALLGLSRQRVHAAGLLDLLDSWQDGPSKPRYFRAEDVGLLADWLQFAVPGMRALGLWKATAPRIPAGGLPVIREWFAADDYGIECPVCGGAALHNYVDPSGSVWCPVDGLVPWREPEGDETASPSRNLDDLSAPEWGE